MNMNREVSGAEFLIWFVALASVLGVLVLLSV
jgi:hypothetical protein